MADQADRIVAALGGPDNIETVTGCVTRVRTEVGDAALVDIAALKSAGAHDVVRMGTLFQIVLGPEADPLAAEIAHLM